MQNLAKAQHMLNIEWKEKPVVCVVTHDLSEACKSLSTQEPGEGKQISFHETFSQDSYLLMHFLF